MNGSEHLSRQLEAFRIVEAAGEAFLVNHSRPSGEPVDRQEVEKEAKRLQHLVDEWLATCDPPLASETAVATTSASSCLAGLKGVTPST